MKKIILVLASAFSLTVSAQKKVEIKASLLDGNNISGTASLANINLITDYGKLVFPIEKVSTINIGIGKDKVVYDKTTALIKVLNNTTSDDTRKGTYEDIIKLGPKAISALEDYSSSSSEDSYIGEYTINNLLSELKANNNLSNVYDVNDVLLFDNGYSIGGNYEFTKIDIKTEYGTLSIPKEKIKSLDIIYIDNISGEQSFKLAANKHISGNTNGGWLKTGIMLKAGQRFTINANGEVILASLSTTQKYKPTGAYTDGSGNSVIGNDSSYSDNTSATSYPSYGNVVYKVGENDLEVKRAGGKFTGVAKMSGILYLAIYETVYSANNTGTYTVKVSTK